MARSWSVECDLSSNSWISSFGGKAYGIARGGQVLNRLGRVKVEKYYTSFLSTVLVSHIQVSLSPSAILAS